MKRRNQKNINTPDFFDKQWKSSSVPSGFDTERQKAMVMPVQDGDRVVDLGCGMLGSCEFAAVKQKKLFEGFCVDWSEVIMGHITTVFPRFTFWKGDVQSTPFRSNYFDVVIISEVIEHLDFPSRVVYEAARLLKPGGVVTCSTLDHSCIQAQALDYHEHVWEFTLQSLQQIFHGCGHFDGKAFQVGNFCCYKGTKVWPI